MPKSNEVAKVLAKFAIGDEEIGLVRAAGAFLEPHIGRLIDDFYRWLSQQPEFAVFFSDDVRSLERIKALQLDYWREFFRAPLDEKYFTARRHVGSVHAHVDLPNDIFFASMALMHELFLMELRRQPEASPQIDVMEAAISKLVFLDSYLVLDEIARIFMERIQAHSRSLNEVSTPVTPIWEGILLLPLLGIVDSSRSQEIMNKTLAKIAETRARIFVLDISGVAAVDTAVANQLIKITKATRLMGCESIISGISPAIARTLVELGISVGEVRTTATLRDALQLGLASIGDGHYLGTITAARPEGAGSLG